MTTTDSHLLELLRTAPDRPGVYIMRDVKSGVLYVGKAAVLKNRLRNYFGPPANLPPKIQTMVSRLHDFEVIVTDTEAEALILESTLIKRFRPPFNARLKDDKSYPYLKIDVKEDFPQVYITRRVEQDEARYFGPFATAWSVRKTLEIIKRLFPYRSCAREITGTDPRPCLDFYLHRCIGPCIGAASREEYHAVIQQVVRFLEGKTGDVVADLRRRMEAASEALEFEKAALLRDQVQAIERVMEEQRIKVASLGNDADLDAVGILSRPRETWVEVFFVRNGLLVGRDHFTMENTEDETPGDVLSEFLVQFYQSASFVPPTVLLPVDVPDAPVLEDSLGRKRGGRVRLEVPRRGERRAFVEMVTANAEQALEQEKARRLGNADLIGNALGELQEALNLPRPPKRIECYDISNVQGTNQVASMVVFEDGASKRAHYRRFQIKGVEGPNDFASMQEVIRRRFKRLQGAGTVQKAEEGSAGVLEGADSAGPPETDSFATVPDLVLIDGGKGQLSSVVEVFLELGILGTIPVASLAKENEWLYTPHSPDPVVLPRDSKALFLAQRVRDEAHRFAITYHRQRRSKSAFRSGLDSVPGVGPKRRRMLLRRFGTVKAIKDASLEDLVAVPGITRSLAEKIKETL